MTGTTVPTKTICKSARVNRKVRTRECPREERDEPARFTNETLGLHEGKPRSEIYLGQWNERPTQWQLIAHCVIIVSL